MICRIVISCVNACDGFRRLPKGQGGALGVAPVWRGVGREVYIICQILKAFSAMRCDICNAPYIRE